MVSLVLDGATADVAATMGITEGAVRKRVSSAVERLSRGTRRGRSPQAGTASDTVDVSGAAFGWHSSCSDVGRNRTRRLLNLKEGITLDRMQADLLPEGDDMKFVTFSRSAVLTPEQYVRLTATQRANISRVRILPPRLGGGFGRLRVTFRKIVSSDGQR